MIFSKQQLFSDQQAITGDAVSTNVIDLGATSIPPHDAAALTRDIGIGSKIPLLIQVTEDFNNLTSLEISLEKDTVSAFSSAETIWSETILLADLVKGARPVIETITAKTDQQYLRLNYNVTGTNPSTGKITAGITMGNQNEY